MEKKEFTDLNRLNSKLEKEEDQQIAFGYLLPAQQGDFQRKLTFSLDGKEYEIDEHGFCLDKQAPEPVNKEI